MELEYNSLLLLSLSNRPNKLCGHKYVSHSLYLVYFGIYISFTCTFGVPFSRMRR